MFDKNNPNFEFTEEYFEYLLNNKKVFDEEDIKMIIECYAIETSYGEFHRWDREATTICQIKDKYYAIDWRQGLTEMQEDSYWDSQPYEVIPVEYQKTVIVKKWYKK